VARCVALVWVLLAGCLAGCGGAPAPARTLTLPGLTPTEDAPAPGAVELALRRADGSFLDLGDLRGQPVLVFVFATYDATSQMALHPLRRIVEEYPDLLVIGIAAHHSARLLVEPYALALRPPFEVTYDPEETVADGRSSLGEIAAVPTFVVLDRLGRPVARHLGFADEAQLRGLLGVAGATPRTPAP
jgi:thiol-disulfide isomerase/thioredoxin